MGVVQTPYSASQHHERGVGTMLVHVPGPHSQVSDMRPLLPRKGARAEGCHQVGEGQNTHRRTGA